MLVFVGWLHESYGWLEETGIVDLPGRTSFTAKQIVTTVMRALSAIGSITVPTTVCRPHLLAIQPSTRSVTPA